jgi:hypothetical protein
MPETQSRVLIDLIGLYRSTDLPTIRLFFRLLLDEFAEIKVAINQEYHSPEFLDLKEFVSRILTYNARISVIEHSSRTDSCYIGAFLSYQRSFVINATSRAIIHDNHTVPSQSNYLYRFSNRKEAHHSVIRCIND